MASLPGLEARFSGRFTRTKGPNAKNLSDIDEVKTMAENFKIQQAIISTQKENIKVLCDLCSEIISGLTVFQQQSGVRQINNIYLPSAEIRNSSGKQLGYVKLCLQFLSAGVKHFMEENINLTTEIREKASLLSALAQYSEDVEILSEIEELPHLIINDSAPVVDTRSEVDSDDD